jgi:hypothetical protein
MENIMPPPHWPTLPLHYVFFVEWANNIAIMSLMVGQHTISFIYKLPCMPLSCGRLKVAAISTIA